MAAIHNEQILRACAELNPGESYVFQFPTPKDAHNEYCYFRTALRSIVQKSPAAKTLTISRNASSVVISMGYPAVLYPTPQKVKTSSLQEESQNDLSPNNETSQQQHPLIARIKSDLAEGLISQEEADEAIEAISTCNLPEE
jgi:hypothetical protein